MKHALPLLPFALALVTSASPLAARGDELAKPASPSASEILAKAAKAQDPAGKAPSSIEDFTVRIVLTTNDPKKGRIEMDVERRFQAPDRIWTRVEEEALSGQRFIEAYDGAKDSGWIQGIDDGEVDVYERPVYGKDLDRLRSELELQRVLLRFFFLRNLVSSMTDVERLPDEAGFGRQTWVVAGRAELPARQIGAARLKLWIDQKSHELLGVRIEPEDPRLSRLQLCFWTFKKNRQGFVVPMSVKIYRNDEKAPSEELFLSGADDGKGNSLNNILFNTGVSDEVFAPPKTR